MYHLMKRVAQSSGDKVKTVEIEATPATMRRYGITDSLINGKIKISCPASEEDVKKTIQEEIDQLDVAMEPGMGVEPIYSGSAGRRLTARPPRRLLSEEHHEKLSIYVFSMFKQLNSPSLELKLTYLDCAYPSLLPYVPTSKVQMYHFRLRHTSHGNVIPFEKCYFGSFQLCEA